MKLKLWSLLFGIFFSTATAPPVESQISPDGTTNTTVNSTDSTITIDSGDRSGDNLFHSFEQFSVPNGNEAFFNNQSNIANIFSRVTGGNISEIEGLIRANGDANLFLINPAGIVFGEGAALDIGGSFTASTAESIVFSDDVEFDATDGDNPPLLTVNMPIGLNYGTATGNIAIDGSNLQVDNGETLAFLGGEVTITGGQIAALGGNIELGGVSGETTVELNIQQSEETTEFISFNFPNDFIGAEIFLNRGANVNVVAEDKGSISLNGSQINLVGGSSLQAGIASGQGTNEAQAGNIEINATETVIIDGVADNSPSNVLNQVEENAQGNAGNIEISANDVEITNGAQLNTSTLGIGKSGTIRINASDTVVFDKAPEGFQSSALSQVGENAVGNSGGIEINANDVEITNGGYLEANTLGMGNAGTIQINTTNTVRIDGESSLGFLSAVFSQVGENAVGSSGGIEINANDVEITNGGQLSANTIGTGDAGKIEITASEKVVFDGQSPFGFASSAFSQVRENAVGNSSGIKINASDVEITNGGQLSATTLSKGNAGIIRINGTNRVVFDGESTGGLTFSSAISQVLTGAEGNSGGIELNGGIIAVTNGAFVDASTLGEGNAGGVKINGNDSIVVNGESSTGSFSYIASAVGDNAIGNSGGIEIGTANLSLQNGGRLTTFTSGQGNAGAINIEASNTIITDGTTQNGMSPSGIFSTVQESGIGNAAKIEIATSNLSVINSAEISVESLGQGNAGDLDIHADSLSLKSGASLFASTSVGRGGNINLQIAENLTLQDNSTISAQATENANGGNINLYTDFVIAQSNQNNDITASAAQGTGGNINITTNAIFGLEERSSTPINNTNDLDASSELGFDGTIEINQLDVNPVEGLDELPIEVIDVAGLVEQNLCQQGQGSEFVVTGKGGTAPSPTQARDGEINEVDLVEPISFVENNKVVEDEGDGEDRREIVEAQGWMINDRAIVELVARKTNLDSSTVQPKSARICHKQ